MSLEEIRNNIRMLCEEMINITSDATFVDDNNAKMQSESDILHILDIAKSAAKKSIIVYEQFRSRISEMTYSAKQYENAIRQLADILKV